MHQLYLVVGIPFSKKSRAVAVQPAFIIPGHCDRKMTLDMPQKFLLVKEGANTSYLVVLGEPP
jgi:hypothetical protein